MLTREGKKIFLNTYIARSIVEGDFVLDTERIATVGRSG